MKKISYSLQIGIVGNNDFIEGIFFDNLNKLAIESNISDKVYEFLIVYKQIPIKIRVFLAETLENLIKNFEKIQRLDVIIIALNLYDKDALSTINKYVVELFNDTFLFQGLSVLVGMDIEQIFKKTPSRSLKISRFQLEKMTNDMNLIYCFEIFNKSRDINELYNTLFNDFILRFQYSSPELFENAKIFGKRLSSQLKIEKL